MVRRQTKTLRTSLTILSALLAACAAAGNAFAQQSPPLTNYCDRLEQEIQNRKHGFVAGNLSYYVGGFHASWNPVEHETLGLTHPFHHDLRSRGVGLAESNLKGPDHTGVGNDYAGWEFYKDTRVLYGSVVFAGRTFEHPKPASMRWRPDKLVCKYELDGVTVHEEKFIAANDVAASIITSTEPISLTFSGHSFFHRNSLTSTAQLKVDAANNALLIFEGGTVRCRPDPNGADRVAKCVYNGMTTVLSASRPITTSIETRQDDRAIQHYSFTVPCDSNGVTVTWAMNDVSQAAVDATKEVLAASRVALAAKTAAMNRLLNEQVPYFRCPDERFVDIYYYLWSLYLMYSINVGAGWEQETHTQTAVNNFLGIHRYDATFQIKVGAWTTDKSEYAYGNVLTWKHLIRNGVYRELPNGIRMLPDNKGVGWHSGAYGGEASEHVLGAWQIFEHTGDLEFLKNCYEGHFSELFRKRITVFAMNEFEVAAALEEMAVQTGNRADVSHWRNLVKQDPQHIRDMFEQRWQANGIKDYFAGPNNGMIMTNGFWAMRSSHFPNEYAKPMLETWALDRKNGFFGDFFPLAMSQQAMRTYETNVDHAFGYTPDTAYFTLDGLFNQRLTTAATELTLNHIEHYNFHSEWNIPVAPEAYRRDGSLFGDQYSNFNAGKILLFLERLAGLKISIPNDQLTIRPALPAAWEWMEVRVPIKGQWTRIQYSDDGAQNGGVQVDGCPLQVVIH